MNNKICLRGDTLNKKSLLQNKTHNYKEKCKTKYLCKPKAPTLYKTNTSFIYEII